MNTLSTVSAMSPSDLAGEIALFVLWGTWVLLLLYMAWDAYWRRR